MSAGPVLGFGIGAVAAGLLATLALRGHRMFPGQVMVENYRGRRVPVLLGLVLIGGLIPGLVFTLAIAWPRAGFAAWDVAVIAALTALFLVGGLDDLRGRGPRGIVGHLRSLARGRPTTGILKLIVGVAGAAAVAALLGGGPLRVIAGTVLVAGCVNLWNALDVVPGRALKWGLLVLLAPLPWAWDRFVGVLAAVTAGAALALLPFDLRERGMLGDSGANPLGLIVGALLLGALPTVGVVVAAAAVLLLQLAAETVTISRLIDSVPPVRWFDRLGRLPE